MSQIAASRLLCIALTASLSACFVDDSVPSPDVAADILKAPPAKIEYPSGVALGDKVVYLGCDIDREPVVLGRPFTLTHYWQAKEDLNEDWKVFVHFEDTANPLEHLNADHDPIDGKYPVKKWRKGEIIRDSHRVVFPVKFPGKTAAVYVGLWKGADRMKPNPATADNRVLAAKLTLQAQPTPSVERKQMLARKVPPTAITLDGKLDEPAWLSADSTGEFLRSLDALKPEQRTEARVLWDGKFVYFAFRMADKDAWATLAKHDDKLWQEEVVEVLIDADGDGKTYVELQANAKGATYDAYLPTYRKAEIDWESELKVAVTVDGTVDVRTDQDKTWTVEMRLPLVKAHGKVAAKDATTVGSVWRMNLFRLDSRDGAQVASSWSPPLVGDFHTLDRFGVLIFADDKGEVPTKNLTVSAQPFLELEPAARAPEKRYKVRAPTFRGMPVLRDEE